MFKNKHIDGKCNRCGEQIAKLRKQLPDKTSQRILADRMQEKRIDMDKNAIQRIEHGDRFVTDIELAAFADFLAFLQMCCSVKKKRINSNAFVKIDI